MTNLSPGTVQVAVRTARLIVTLDRESARTAQVSLADADGITVRAGRPGQWVVEASGPGTATLRLVALGVPGGGAVRVGAAMAGPAQLTIRSVPIDGGVAGGLEWTVTQLRPEGRTVLDVLSLQHDGAHSWTMRSLLADTPPMDPDPASQAARQYLGDQAAIAVRALVAVDRSASLMWAYQPGGDLQEVLRGLWAALTHAVLTHGAAARDEVQWLTYGSGVGTDQLVRAPQSADDPGSGNLAERAARELLTRMRPALFASGSNPALVADHAARTGCDLALLVTDSLAAIVPSGPRKAVVLLGAASGTRLTADEVAQLQVAAAAGVPVLRLAPGGVDARAVTRWTIDQVRATSSVGPAAHGQYGRIP